jgi:glycosyltransferase involved in cell wall biosynthesis
VLRILLVKAFPRLSSVGHLATELKRRGHDVHVAVPAEPSDVTRMRARGIPVHVVPFALPRGSEWTRTAGRLGIATRLARLIRTEAVDVVHLNLAAARLHGRLASLIARPRAVVSSIRGFEARYERWTNWIDHATVTVSAAVRGYLTGLGVPEKKLVTIPNGLDLEECRQVPEDPAYLHRALGLAAGVPLVGMVGYYRSHEMKGHRVFFEAARVVARERPDVRFVSVGSSLSKTGFTQAYFERHVQDLGIGDRVFFLGERDDVLPIMGSFAVHALPSFREGCPMVVLEAMGRGVPNVVSRIAGMTELIEHGRSGLLVEPDDPQALADALLFLLRDRDAARAIGEAGRRRVESHFTAAQMAERYEELFRRVVETGRRRLITLPAAS